MGALRSLPVDEIIRRGSIKNVDVLRLKSSYHYDGMITESEADALLRLNEACLIQDPSWPEFFVEAVSFKHVAHWVWIIYTILLLSQNPVKLKI